jgi:hypothetical protein
MTALLVQINRRYTAPVTSFTVDLRPSQVRGAAPAGNSPTTSSSEVVVTGGTGPFTYSWVRVGSAAPSGGFTPDDDTAAETFWTYGVLPLGFFFAEEWKCVVTDTATSVVRESSVLMVMIQEIPEPGFEPSLP